MTRTLPVILLLAFAGVAPAQTPAPPKPDSQKEYLRANYTKFEYRIPMRDGTKLFTAVYVPKDESKAYPILLNRTPYSVGPYGVDHYPDTIRPGKQYIEAGYIFALQDVRGCWMSEGVFENMRPHIPNKTGKQFDESSDTYDTVEWLINNVPNNNGKVGQHGISYPGFYTAAGMIDAHPALRASSPQAPINDWFVGDDFHHNGCLFLPHAFNFLASFGVERPGPLKKREGGRFDHGTPDGYQFFLDMGPLKNADAKYFQGKIKFWNTMLNHDTYDEFWQARNLRPHIKEIKPAVLTVGGVFDAENLFGAVETFKAAEKNKSEGPNHLVLGPWNHGGWSRGAGDTLGDLHFGAKTGEQFKTTIEFPFFEHHLKGKADPKLAKAQVFETGTNRWRSFGTWPPKSKDGQALQQFLVLDGTGKLAIGAQKRGEESFDEFVSDPAKPVPFTEKMVPAMTNDYMTYDQRFASRRPDVLVYQSPVLEDDLTLAGPVRVKLKVSTTGTDADWCVKLIDVYPGDHPDPEPNPKEVRMGGYQQLIRGEIFRGKFRNSFAKPEPFKPNEPAEVSFTMPDILHTVRPGHRLMVQVQSSWFPLADRNPQTFCDINAADENDFKKQTHRVYHGSSVTVGVVK